MGAFFVILIIAIIAGTIALATRASRINKGVTERLSQQLDLGAETSQINSFENVQYLGGHPMLPNTGTAIISFRERGFVVVAGRKAAASKYSIVKAVDILSQEQISKDVTLTRLLALGVFAFGVKKKTTTQDTYVRLVIELKGIESTVLFKTSNGGNIASRINAGRIATA